MSRYLLAAATTVALSFASSPSAYASCSSLVAFSPLEKRQASYLAASPDGPGAGDKMIGQRALESEEDGSSLGTIFWTVDVLDVNDSGLSTDKTLSLVAALNDGAIFAFVESAVPVDSAVHPSTTVTHPSGGSIIEVIGGTGAYADARGTLTIKNRDDGVVYSFDLSCKEQ